MKSDKSLLSNGSPADEAASPSRGWRRQLFAAVRLAQVRFRFLAVFLIAFLVVGNWETLRNYWDRWTASSRFAAPQAVSVDAEYFCPMCPGVVSNWPTKCPVCNMGLVRRKKGGPVQLPDGIISRMQYSPQRLQLAGVRTAIVEYLPLAKEVLCYGFATANALSDETDQAPGIATEVEAPQGDAALMRIGHAAQIRCGALPGLGPWKGRVARIDLESPAQSMSAKIRVEIADPKSELSAGLLLSVGFELPIVDVEPFRSQPSNPEPLQPDEPRLVFICPNHPDDIRLSDGKCPRDGIELLEQPLTENQRLTYWCPMHPEVTSRAAGEKCEKCNGMILLPRITVFRPSGRVLAVPETAVVDTGTRRMVYVDRGDGMFDGVEVVVGPRAGGCYAIVSGLEAGQKVAASGAFLLDAETRLNPNVASAYFGATTAGGSGSEAGSGAAESQP
jgi:hypothetical protein